MVKTGIMVCLMAMVCQVAASVTVKGQEIFFQYGQVGLRSAEGQVLIPPRYKSITIEKDTIFQVETFSEWFLLDEQGKIAKTLLADSILPRSYNAISLFRNGQEIVLDSLNRPVFNEELNLIRLLNHQEGIVEVNGKLGISKVSGRTLIPTEYDSIALDGDFYYCLIEKQKPHWDIYNRYGRKINPRPFEDLHIVPKNLIPVSKNGYWGFINFDGEYAIDLKFDDVTPFTDGVAKVRYLEGDGIINRKGDWMIPPYQAKLVMVSSDLFLNQSGDRKDLLNKNGEIIYQTYNELEIFEYGLLEQTEEGKIGLISLTGHMVVPPEYDYVEPVQNGELILLKKEGEVYAINQQGDAVIGAKMPYQDILGINEELVSIKKDGRYGFVDLQDNLRISNRYEKVDDFHNGMAAVMLRGKWGFIDRFDRLKIQPRYDEVQPFTDSISVVRAKGFYGMIDYSGDELVPTEMDSIIATGHEQYIVFKAGRQGLINRGGAMMITPKYDEVEVAGANLVIARLNGKSGILKSNGTNLTPFSFRSLYYDDDTATFYGSTDEGYSKSIYLGQLR